MSNKNLFSVFAILLLITLLAACGTSNASLQPNNSPSTGGGATGTAALSWIAPTTYSDNVTPLMPVGFKIYYGQSSNYYTQVIDVQNGSSTHYTISGLTPGTYYFSVTAYDASRIESSYSTEVSKTI